jgi:serine/threonine protein phosphatase PrpC
MILSLAKGEEIVSEDEDYPLPYERSGSTSLICIVLGKVSNYVDNDFHIANVGDSRALLSYEGGSRVYLLSEDHRPDQDAERIRILQAGGQIYQT